MNEKKLVPSQLHSRLRSKRYNWLHWWLWSEPGLVSMKRTFSRIRMNRLQLDDICRFITEES
jgi:hypothetical protein